jgi:hypothetical protein
VADLVAREINGVWPCRRLSLLADAERLVYMRSSDMLPGMTASVRVDNELPSSKQMPMRSNENYACC